MLEYTSIIVVVKGWCFITARIVVVVRWKTFYRYLWYRSYSCFEQLLYQNRVWYLCYCSKGQLLIDCRCCHRWYCYKCQLLYHRVSYHFIGVRGSCYLTTDCVTVVIGVRSSCDFNTDFDTVVLVVRGSCYIIAGFDTADIVVWSSRYIIAGFGTAVVMVRCSCYTIFGFWYLKKLRDGEVPYYCQHQYHLWDSIEHLYYYSIV